MRRLARSIYAKLPFKRQAFELLRPLGLPRRLYQHLHFTGPFQVALPGASFVMWSHGDQVENELFWGGFAGAWEQTSLEVWRRLATATSGAILDIGANTGIYALTASAVAPEATVIAYEPLRRVAERASRNVALNGFAITVDARAVSDRSGSAMIHDAPGDNVYSASLEMAFPGFDQSYEVQTIALDDEAELPPLGLIKLDVEMHEPAAIRGMLRTLRRDRPAILVEVLTAEVGEDLYALLSEFGYRIFQIKEAQGLVESPRLEPAGGHNWNNLLCTTEQFEAAGLDELLL